MTDRLPDDVTLANLNGSPAPLRRPAPTRPAVPTYETPGSRPAAPTYQTAGVRPAGPARKPAPPLEKATRAPRAGKPAKHTALGAKIAVTGIGVATMLGLVGSMEIKSLDQAAAANPTPGGQGTTTSVAFASPHESAAQQAAIARANKAAVKARQPIVLTPHNVVNVVHVAAPASSGGGSSGGYASAPSYSAPSYSAPAAAPAAAPVASTSGSH